MTLHPFAGQNFAKSRLLPVSSYFLLYAKGKEKRWRSVEGGKRGEKQEETGKWRENGKRSAKRREKRRLLQIQREKSQKEGDGFPQAQARM